MRERTALKVSGWLRLDVRLIVKSREETIQIKNIIAPISDDEVEKKTSGIKKGD